MVRESRDAKSDENGVIWYPTLQLRRWFKSPVSASDGELQQLWRRPDTFEEQWRQIDLVFEVKTHG